MTLAPPWHEFTTASRNMLLALLFAVLVMQSACATGRINGNPVKEREKKSRADSASLEQPSKRHRQDATSMTVQDTEVTVICSRYDGSTFPFNNLDNFLADSASTSTTVGDLQNYSVADPSTGNTLDFDCMFPVEVNAVKVVPLPVIGTTSRRRSLTFKAATVDGMAENWSTIELDGIFLSTEEVWHLSRCQMLPLPGVPVTLPSDYHDMPSHLKHYQLDKTWPSDPPRLAPMSPTVLRARECLLAAIFQSRFDWVMCAINHGVDLNQPVYDSKHDIYVSYLTMAVHSPQLSSLIAAMLIASGASVNQLDSNGMASLHWACRLNRPKWLLLFHEAGVDMNASMGMGMRPIHLAAKFNSRDTLLCILELDRVHVNELDGAGNHFLFHVLPHLSDDLDGSDMEFFKHILQHNHLFLTDSQIAAFGIQLVSQNRLVIFKCLTSTFFFQKSSAIATASE